MVVLILERVPASLRGELTRWMLEPRTGVFVGTISAMVRDKLWDQVCKSLAEGRRPRTREGVPSLAENGRARSEEPAVRAGGAILIYNSDTEQGFAIRLWGVTDRLVADFDGLSLIRLP